MVEIQIFLDRKTESALTQNVIHLRVPRIARTALERRKLIGKIRRHGDDALDFSLGSGIELIRMLSLDVLETVSFENMVVIITADNLRGTREAVEACRQEIARALRSEVPRLAHARLAVSVRGAHDFPAAA